MAKNAAALLEPNTGTAAKGAAMSEPVAAEIREEKPKGAEVPPIQPEKALSGIIIEAPMGHCESGYATNHIDFQGMTPRQRAAAKRLMMSLDAANERVEMCGVRYPKGKVVHDYGDSIRWIYEKLADAWEAEKGRDITAGLEF